MITVIVAQENIEIPAIEIESDPLTRRELDSLAQDIASAARKAMARIEKRAVKREIEREVQKRMRQGKE